MQAPVIRSTAEFNSSGGIKGLIYGKAGIGKTVLAATTGVPTLIIATEPGLLSLRQANMAFIEARTAQELRAVAAWIRGSAEARNFGCFFIDSLSEVLEILLAEERIRVGAKEPRKAYNELLINALELIRLYRDIAGPHVIFTAKREYAADETGARMYGPKFPGKAMGIEAPYFFDFVFSLELWQNPQDLTSSRVLRCQPNNQYEAKDRSGALAELEHANLAQIFAKIRG